MKDLMKPDYDLHFPHHHQSLGASNSRVSMNKTSHVISKVKPKIRIIHIFAPEIIKTDVKNFRPLVQRLTGKPAAGEAKTGKKKRTKPPRVPVIGSQDSTGGVLSTTGDQVNRLNGFTSLLASGSGNDVKEELGSGECSNPMNTTYFDLDGLIQDFGDEFSSFPIKSSHHHMDGFNVHHHHRQQPL